MHNPKLFVGAVSGVRSLILDEMHLFHNHRTPPYLVDLLPKQQTAACAILSSYVPGAAEIKSCVCGVYLSSCISVPHTKQESENSQAHQHLRWQHPSLTSLTGTPRVHGRVDYALKQQSEHLERAEVSRRLQHRQDFTLANLHEDMRLWRGQAHRHASPRS